MSHMNWKDTKPLDLNKIKFLDFPEDKYYRTVYEKKQVVLHHTVSGPGTRGDIATWLRHSGRIATCIIIDRDGTPNQLFSSRFWAYHLGAGSALLDKHSIGIEFDNWGQLEKKGDSFYTVYGNRVNVPVTEYEQPFRGERYFESYTTEQIRTAAELLLLWNQRYDIPLDYNTDMWEVSERALDGEPGVWSHVSFRDSGKWDCHPQPELIDMLRNIKCTRNE